MLNISSVGSAGGAAAYYAKDNYYTKDQSETTSMWHGKGAEDIGLTGQVTEEALERVLSGNIDGQQVGNGTHNPGRDFTFSMPKSASIMAYVGGDTRIEEAYIKSVKKTLDYVEKHLVSTRQRDAKGNRVDIQTGNAIIAMFPQDTSRLQDPNGHIHAVIANAAKTEDGTYKAINFYPVYQNTYHLDKIAHELFKHELNKMGYETENVGTHFEIVGVPNEINEHFSKRRAEVLQELKDIANPTYKDRQNAAINTRESKGEYDRPDLVRQWRQEAKALGFDAERFVQTVRPPKARTLLNQISRAITALFTDKYAHFKGDGTRLDSLSEITKFSIKVLAEKDITFTKTALIAEVTSIAQGSVSPTQVESQIAKELKSQNLVQYKPQVNSDRLFTTQAHIKSETNIIEMIKAGRDAAQLYKPSPSSLALIDKTVLNSRLDASGKEIGQRPAANMILFGADYVSGIQGYAGVGKTFMLSETLKIAEALNAEQGHRYSFAALAPTLTAVHELKEKAGIDHSKTLQKFQADFEASAYNNDKRREMVADYKDKVLYVDESSMVSLKDMEKFIEQTKALEVKKIVFIGDVDQIQSILAGAPFRLMQQYGMTVTVVDEIFRQKNKTVKQAVYAATERDIAKSFEILGNYVTNHKDPAKQAAKDYVDRLSPDVRSKLITPENRTIQDLTQHVRELLKERGLIDKTDIKITTLRSRHLTDLDKRLVKNYRPGNSLLFHKTVAQGNFEAGETYRITSVNKETGRLKLKDSNGRTLQWTVKSDISMCPYDVVSTDKTDFSKGDKVTFKLHDKENGIERNSPATIVDINKNNVTLATKSGDVKTLTHTDLGIKGMTHDYASTVHAFQGKDVDVNYGVMLGKAVSSTYENFYTLISRTVSHLHIYTDNKDDLEKSITRASGNRSHFAIEHAGARQAEPDQPAKTKSEPNLVITAVADKSPANEITPAERTRTDRSR